MRPLERVKPKGPPQAYKTYSVLAPPSTHWRAASCAEVDCQAYRHGWRTVVDTTRRLGREQADYIRARCGRAYVELAEGDGRVAFVFEAGQRCFAADSHRVRLDRPAIYTVRDGDHRAGANLRRFGRAGQWLDDFATHQSMIAERRKRG